MFGEQLDKKRVRRPPVHDHRRLGTAKNGIDAGLDLRDHAAAHGAVADQRFRLGHGQFGDQGPVSVENTGDIGQHQHARRPEGGGDGAGRRVGIDVVGLAFGVTSNRRHDGNQVGGVQRLEDGGVDMFGLTDKTKIDGILDGAASPSSSAPSACAPGSARHPCR